MLGFRCGVDPLIPCPGGVVDLTDSRGIGDQSTSPKDRSVLWALARFTRLAFTCMMILLMEIYGDLMNLLEILATALNMQRKIVRC